MCAAEQHIVGLHCHILKIVDAAETQLEYAEITKYSVFISKRTEERGCYELIL